MSALIPFAGKKLNFNAHNSQMQPTALFLVFHNGKSQRWTGWLSVWSLGYASLFPQWRLGFAMDHYYNTLTFDLSSFTSVNSVYANGRVKWFFFFNLTTKLTTAFMVAGLTLSTKVHRQHIKK